MLVSVFAFCNFPVCEHIKCKESEEAYPDEGLEGREVCAFLRA